MALIKCPECGKEISDKSHQCIHCGYPLEEIEVASKPVMKLYKVVLEDVSPKNKVRIIKVIRECTGLGLAEAKALTDTVPSVIKTELTLEEAQRIGTELSAENARVSISDSTDNKVMRFEDKLFCPRCHSTFVTTGSRGFSFVTGFLGSGKTVNRCGKCGYKWTPR